MEKNIVVKIDENCDIQKKIFGYFKQYFNNYQVTKTIDLHKFNLRLAYPYVYRHFKLHEPNILQFFQI